MATETGRITINETSIVELDSAPNNEGGTDFPVATLAIDKNTGILYRKASLSPTGWVQIAAETTNTSSSDFMFESALSVRSNSSFGANSRSVTVKKGKDVYLEINGSVAVFENGNIRVGPFSSLLVRSL